MKTINLGNSDLEVPVVALGCMRINGLEMKEAEALIRRAVELGVNFFDHADIYGGGQCEAIFARASGMTPGLRERMIIQSKCGIVPGKMYDCSKEYILKSVDGILKRLNTEYLDVLLLHRPDALMEPEETAEAFESLRASGKVRYFGVSNHKPSQIKLLQKYMGQPILANQLQLSVTDSNMIRQGLEVNMGTEGAVDRDESVLDFCRLSGITIQVWSPFRSGKYREVFLNNDKFPELNRVLEEMAEKYHTSATAVSAAWVLRHPAKMQLIAGTTNPGRLEEICGGAGIELKREDWYRIYLSAGHILP